MFIQIIIIMAATSITVKDFRNEIPGNLTPDNLTWEFPVVESTNSHGKKTKWQIYVRMMTADTKQPVVISEEFFNSKPILNAVAVIDVSSGLADGKRRDTVPTVVSSGKNIGKKNETNVWTQALRNALGLYNKQSKKVTQKNPEAVETTATELYPPMLAQILSEQKTPPKIDNDHPAFVQRKYNGVRIVSTLNTREVDNARVVMYSRRKNLYPGFDYIKNELEPVLKFFWEEGRHIYLDGEVYKHGESLQLISGYSRREDRPGDIQLDYMIYDCFIPDEPNLIYSERKKILDHIFSEFEFNHVKCVETWEVNSREEIDELYKKFIAEGFEGAMVRTNTPYRYSYNEYHSKNLLKIKPTMDAEFTIVGYESGERGKAANSLMIICETSDKKQFHVTPAMTIPEREALLKKMGEIEPNNNTHFANHWLGKPLIVEFDEYDKTGTVPQRARTKMIIRTAE